MGRSRRDIAVRMLPRLRYLFSPCCYGKVGHNWSVATDSTPARELMAYPRSNQFRHDLNLTEDEV